MESMPSMEVVMQALNSLYRGNDSEAREAASKWLMEMQKSVSLVERESDLNMVTCEYCNTLLVSLSAPFAFSNAEMWISDLNNHQ